MANEDFTTWTENDPQSRLTVTSSSITINDLERDDLTTWVYYDFGADYWNGDISVRFKYTTPVTEDSTASSWIYPLAFTNTVDEQNDIESGGGDSQGVLFLNSAGTPRFPIYHVEAGSRTTSYPTDLSWGTAYYITIERDDDGGVNSTGQLTLRVYTTNFYGESGAVEHSTVTLDCSAGEQNDFRYIMLASPRGTGTEATDGLIENLELTSSINYVDMSGTVTGAGYLTGSLDTGAGLSGTITAISTVTGFVSSGPLSGAKVENYTRYLVAFGNDTCSYQSG